MGAGYILASSIPLRLCQNFRLLIQSSNIQDYTERTEKRKEYHRRGGKSQIGKRIGAQRKLGQKANRSENSILKDDKFGKVLISTSQ